MNPRTLILRTAGTNCDVETAHAFALAGSSPEFLHINRLIENPKTLDQFQLLAIPGGFSYGDDIAAGRIFANQLIHHLRDALHRFVNQKKPIIGICNGFQVLVKTGLLPGALGGCKGQTCTLAHNDSGRFIDRWVRLTPQPSRCIWTANLTESIDLPIAHGEGKFVPATEAVRRALWDDRRVGLTYTTDNPESSPFIGNPNGSIDAIAGICDSTGLILGLMPHPERHVTPFQHPAWTRSVNLPAQGAGLCLFKSAVDYASTSVGVGV